MEIPFKNKVYKMIPERSENGRKSMIKTKLWRIDHELIPGQFIDVVANVWVPYTENVSYIKWHCCPNQPIRAHDSFHAPFKKKVKAVCGLVARGRKAQLFSGIVLTQIGEQRQPFCGLNPYSHTHKKCRSWVVLEQEDLQYGSDYFSG